MALLMAILVITPGCSRTAEPSTTLPGTSATVEHYTYEVVNAYPHDVDAFTEGLAFDNGTLYESTGLRGRSSLRKVELETGAVTDSIKLDRSLFGEGIAVVGNKIVQLTWQSGMGFVYNKSDLHLLSQFAYDTEGWGLTCDGQRLIMSDGTATLYFLDPESFAVEGSVKVTDGATPVTELNELEFIDGLVYANVWKTDRIAIINPGDGRVTG